MSKSDCIITSKTKEFIHFDRFSSFIIQLINLSITSIHQCSLIILFAVFCITAKSDDFIILPTFCLQASSICLTLSLVIEGENEFHILCNVSLTHNNQTLLSSTFLSLSDKDFRIVPKLDTILSFVNIFVAIIYYSILLYK
jgi:hypothetical protein